jgi:hypothetical protein
MASTTTALCDRPLTTAFIFSCCATMAILIFSPPSSVYTASVLECALRLCVGGGESSSPSSPPASPLMSPWPFW